MISASQSALSGLQAFATRLHSHGDNVANSSSERYKKSRVIISEANSGGAATTVERVDTPGMKLYEEMSTGSELIELSNVDLATELTGMTLSARFYQANLRTLQTSDEMLGSLLDLKA